MLRIRPFQYKQGGTVRGQRDYISYLLRLWRVSGDEGSRHMAEGAEWRASLTDPHSGRRHGFASLEELFEFLRAEIGKPSEPATGRAGRREDRA